MVDDTQHYSPSQSPVSPKNLEENFDAADPSPEHDTVAGRRKAAKRQASDEDENPKPNEKKKKGEVSREDDDGKEDPAQDSQTKNRRLLTQRTQRPMASAPRNPRTRRMARFPMMMVAT